LSQALPILDFTGTYNQTSNLRFAHAAFNVPPVNVLLLNSTQQIVNTDFAQVSSYNISTNTSGPLWFSIVNSGNATDIVLPSTSVQFDLLNNYTLVLAGAASSAGNYSTLQLINFPDDLSVYYGKAKLRFIHLVPDFTGPLSVTLTSGANDVIYPSEFVNTPHFTASSPTIVAPNKYIIRAILTTNVTANITYTVVSPTASLEANSVYSAFFEGLSANLTSLRLVVVKDFTTNSPKRGLSPLELGLIIGGGILFAILLLAIIVFALRSRSPDGYEPIH